MKKLYVIIILIILFLFLREFEIYSKINFHKIFYPKYYEYDKFNLDWKKTVVGILNWIVYQEEKKLLDTKEPIAVINIDVSNSEICFCHI